MVDGVVSLVRRPRLTVEGGSDSIRMASGSTIDVGERDFFNASEPLVGLCLKLVAESTTARRRET